MLNSEFDKLLHTLVRNGRVFAELVDRTTVLHRVEEGLVRRHGSCVDLGKR